MTVTTDRLEGKIGQGLALLLLVSISMVHIRGLELLGYGATSVTYVVIVAVCLREGSQITPKRSYLILFGIFSVVATIRTVIGPEAGGAVRLLALLVFTSTNLFFIPSFIRFADFSAALARYAAAIVVIGFAPLVGVNHIGPVDLSLWHGYLYWYPSIGPLTSIFPGPNALGFLALSGAFAAFVRWHSERSLLSGLLVAVTAGGLLWTNYRTGMIALGAGVVLYSIYVTTGRRGISVATAAGVVGSVVGLAAILFLTDISLNHRRSLWKAGYYGLLERPVLGHGLGGTGEAISPHLVGTSLEDTGLHNSYLRMFVGLGVAGGVLYSGIVGLSMIRSARESVSPRMAILSAMISAFAVVQVFNGLTFIGISMHSTLISVVLGYHFTGGRFGEVPNDGPIEAKSAD